MLASLKGPEEERGDTNSAPEQPGTTAGAQQTGKLKVILDRKGRKGKVATIVEGFTLPDEQVEEIASELKRKIGTGGSARGGEILIQGDWTAKVSEILRSRGFKL